MKNVSAVLFALLSLLSACGPTTPTEAEVRAYISGTYCLQTDAGIFYQLSLADSSYQMVKSTPGPLNAGMQRESCQGTYTLVFDAGAWHIYYSENQSPQRTTIYDCQHTYLIWSPQDHYIGGPEKKVMKDLFDEQELFAAACKPS